VGAVAASSPRSSKSPVPRYPEALELSGKVIVITGAARGIGRAMAERFARESPAAVILADIDAAAAAEAARGVNGAAVTADVSSAQGVTALVETVLDRHGRIDLFCSNAGVLAEGGVEQEDPVWDRLWEINVKSHLWAARAALPAMLARGEGYLLNTVSAAGLLTSLGAAPYAVSKHAALALAEWLHITYRGRGIRVSALCPAFVRTSMVYSVRSPMRDWMLEGSISPEAVAESAVAGLRDERFLILPHPEVGEQFRRKANDYDRWLAGMRRLAAKVNPDGPESPRNDARPGS